MKVMLQKLIHSILVLGLCGVFVACSEEDSEKVDISFSPENPRVYFYDLPLTLYTDDNGDPVTTVIKQPWFRVQLNVNNGADKSLVISNFNLTVKGVSASQGFSSSAIQISPSSLFVNNNADEDDDLTVMAEISASNTALIPAVDPDEKKNYIYIHSLPSDVTTGVFNVEVEAVGWFGTIANPMGVFRQKYYFTTD